MTLADIRRRRVDGILAFPLRFDLMMQRIILAEHGSRKSREILRAAALAAPGVRRRS
jgi:hypothetical protein